MVRTPPPNNTFPAGKPLPNDSNTNLHCASFHSFLKLYAFEVVATQCILGGCCIK